MSLIDRLKGKIPSAKEADGDTVRDQADKLRNNGKFAEAAEAYAEYLTRNPTDFNIWVQRGNCLKDSGSYSASKSAYERALALNSSDDDVYLQLGHLMKKQNRHKEAIRYYKEALRVNEKNQNAINELRALGLNFAVLRRLYKIQCLVLKSKFCRHK